MTTATTTVSTAGETDRRRERHNLVRHFVEMVLATIAGMAVLGVVIQGICAVMFVPVAVLIGPCWAGALSGGGLLDAMRVRMLRALVLARRHRRDEYVRAHRRHVAAFLAPSAA